MNRTFQHVWNYSLKQWQVAGEHAKQPRGNSGSRKLTLAKALSAIFLSLNGQLVLALPTGGSVAQGSAQISETGSVMTIDQDSQRTVINWDSFDIEANETVNFQQPNLDAVALNRILGSNASQIFGKLNANGQIFLVNTNGITFAPGSQVNTSALIASTLDIDDNDFMSGSLQFSKSGNKLGNISNHGTIHASTIALLANQVSNEGYLIATTSSTSPANVALAAGDNIIINFGPNGLLDLEVDKGSYDALVENKSIIEANGGQILMLAQAASQLSSATVNNTGIVQAQGLANHNGRIVLLADMAQGSVKNSGTLDVSNVNGEGGFIETSAADISITSDSVIKLGGTSDNGTWLIDPNDIEISNAATADIDASMLSTSLNSGDIILQTTNRGSPGGSGNITINDTISWSANKNTLSLYAENQILINADIEASGDQAGLHLFSRLSFDDAGSNWTKSLGNGFSFGDLARSKGILLAEDTMVTLSGKDAVYQAENVSYQVINGNNSSIGSAATESAIDELESITNGHYVLGIDIDASAKNFNPISIFSGGIEGLGHIIENLTINRPNLSNVGLIRRSNGAGAYFRNLDLSDVDISGASNVGTLIGHGNGVYVYKIRNTGTIKGAGNNQFHIGGLIGNGNLATIEKSSFKGDITVKGDDIGGLIGKGISSIINGSSYEGTITVTKGSSDFENIGGLIGHGDKARINTSYANANVNAINSGVQVGGIVGRAYGLNLNKVTFNGNVKGGAGSGGILGKGIDARFNSVTASGSVEGRVEKEGIGGLVGILDADKNSPNSLFTNINVNNTISGNHRVGGWFGIAHDLVLNNASSNQIINGRQATGGIIGYAIRSTINNAQYQGDLVGQRNRHGGIVGRAANTTVNNSTFIGSISNNNEAGGIIGFGENSSVLSSQTFGSIDNNQDRAGGLIGNLDGGSIANSFSQMSINSTTNAGGLLGLVNDGNITNSYSTGDITATSNVGGLIGHSRNSTISNTYSVGNVNGSGSNIGGLIGNFHRSTLRTSYASGIVTSNGEFGLVGNSNSSSVINRSYWNAFENSKGIGGGAKVTNSEGLNSDSELKTAGSYNGFNFSACGGSSIWCISEGNATPGLNSLYRNVTITTSIVGTNRFEYNGEVHSANLTFSLDDRASEKLVYGNGISTNGSDAKSYSGENLNYDIYSSQYNLNIAGNSITLIIDPKQLGIAATVDNKVYDGNTNANVTSIDLTGIIAGDSVNLASSSAAFSDKDVGDGKTVNINDIVLSGADKGNYSITSGTSQANITAKQITVSSTASDKVYDGNTSATVSFELDGIIGSDAVSVKSANSNFDNKNVDTNKVVSSTDIVLEGDDSKNYELASNSSTDLADITAKQITVSSTANNKVYDGNTSATVSFELDGVIGADSVSVKSANSNFDNKNADTDKVVSSTNIVLEGDDSKNYKLASNSATDLADITAKQITVSSSASDKIYDGNTEATVTLGLNGLIASDSVTVSSANDNFDNKNAGVNKTVTSTGILLNGADSDNYSLVSTTATDQANISAKEITVSSTASDKIYDGNTSATVSFELDGIIGSDAVSVKSANSNFDDKNVDTNKVVSSTDIVLEGDDSKNYELASNSSTDLADITAKQITVSSTANNKVYDGNTSATVSFELDGVIGTDSVSVKSANSNFDNKNADTDKVVSSTNIVLEGDDSKNYELASNSATDLADITAKQITVSSSASDKIYDGNTEATVTLGLNGIIASDSVTVSSANDNFDNKNAGVNKTVTSTGILLNGADSDNYSLVSTTATDQANISAKEITVSSTASDKVYDGNTSATVSFKLDGIIGSDAVSVKSANSNFDDKNVDTNKVVSSTDIVLEGDDSKNYELASNSSTDLADITAKQITVSSTASDKVYDGNTEATVTLELNDVVASDSVTVRSTNDNFDNKNAGANKTVTSTGITLEGEDSGNYSLVSTTTTDQADISAKQITVSSTASDKIYDGDTSATVSFELDGIIGSDAVSVKSANSNFDNKNVDTDKTVSSTNIVLEGDDSKNYELASDSATDLADITAKQITVSSTASDKIYDGNTEATVALGLNGIIASDSVTVSSANDNFDNKNAGVNKTVTSTGISLDGADSGNYSLVSTTSTDQADISAKQITVSSTASDKVYDGTTSATVGFELDGIIGSDAVSVKSANNNFDNKNVDTNKVVSSTDIVLEGDDSKNYELASDSTTDLADITAKQITVSSTASDKVYDGNTEAIVTLGLNGIIASDSVTVSSTSSSFDSKNAGTNKTVTSTGISLDGADSANYSLVTTTSTDQADISAKQVVVSSTANDKIYDGNTDANVVLGLNGVIDGDTVSVSATSNSFDNKNAGTGKIVTSTDITLAGLDSDNYSLANTTTTGTADITAKTLEITATADDKNYDGSVDATVELQLTGTIEGDIVSATATTNRFDDKNVGQDKVVSSTDISLNGLDSSNYVLSQTDVESEANINAIDLIIKANDDSQTAGPIYNGGNGITATGFIANESVADLTGQAIFGGNAQGAAAPGSYTINVSGFDSLNYDIRYEDGTLLLTNSSNGITDGASNPVAPNGAAPILPNSPGGLNLPLGPTAAGGEGDEESVDTLLEGDLLVFGGGSKRPGTKQLLNSLEELCDKQNKPTEIENCRDQVNPGK